LDTDNADADVGTPGEEPPDTIDRSRPDSSVPELAHAIGLGLGVISALVYFKRNRESIRAAEVVELEEPFDDPEEIQVL
jgi:hypothetical protein